MSEGESGYDWVKRRVRSLFSDVDSWANDSDITYEKVDVWTVKKLLAIDWYLLPFHRIAKKNFEYIAYIDFFCGSGLMRFGSEKYSKKHLCKGSALIPLFRADMHPFTEYFFFDTDKAKVEALRKRIERVKREKTLNPALIFNLPELLPFEQSSRKLFGPRGLLNKKPLSLVVVDPEGYAEVRWDLIENILHYGKVDLIMTFMTFGILRNRGIALKDLTGSHARGLDAFFGDSGWRDLDTADDILRYYCDKIRRLGYQVRTVSVNEQGRRRVYDIIFASKNPAVGERIFTDLENKMEDVTSELLADAIGVNQKESLDLDGFM